MTFEEFKQILKDAGMPFDIWGYEGILNEITIAQDFLAKETEHDVLKKMYSDKSRFIHGRLKERGYYE